MRTDADVTWIPLAGVTPDLVALARRCLQADGGLPLADEPGFLQGRWAVPGGIAFALPAAGGGLLAAGAVRPTAAGATFTGLVDPAARGRGMGSALLDRGLAEAARVSEAASASEVAGLSEPASASELAGLSEPASASEVPGLGEPASTSGAAGVINAAGVTEAAPGSEAASSVNGGSSRSWERRAGGRVIIVETESLSADASSLFASRGLRQVFAEDVMRIDLIATAVPQASWPEATTLHEWSAATAGRFHAAYELAFRERPGFPGTPAAEWIADNEADVDFRADWSLLASVPGVGDAGFVIGAGGWIVQVGVVPAARRRGIGAALIQESLARMVAAGATEAYLTVNVNNPHAAALYRRLGFADAGRRARYQR